MRILEILSLTACAVALAATAAAEDVSYVLETPGVT